MILKSIFLVMTSNAPFSFPYLFVICISFCRFLRMCVLAVFVLEVLTQMMSSKQELTAVSLLKGQFFLSLILRIALYYNRSANSWGFLLKRIILQSQAIKRKTKISFWWKYIVTYMTEIDTKSFTLKCFPAQKKCTATATAIQFNMEVDPTVDLCNFREYNIPW